jgi:1,4-dihydroxy-2-naphthoate octaprenyltransferase
MSDDNDGCANAVMFFASILFIGIGIGLIFGTGWGFITLGVLCFIVFLIWSNMP